MKKLLAYCHQHKKELHVILLNFSQAYEGVERDNCMKQSKDRVNGALSSIFKMERRFNSLSAELFNIIGEKMIRNSRHVEEK